MMSLTDGINILSSWCADRPTQRALSTDGLLAQLRIANREQEKLVIDLEDLAKVRFR
jgi:hypothetical protein